MKLLVVTRDQFRHRLFLRMVKEQLGGHWCATLIQTPREAAEAPPPSSRPPIWRRMRSLLGAIVRRITPWGNKPSVGIYTPLGAIFKKVPAPKGLDLADILPDIEPLDLAEAPNVLFAPDPNDPESLKWLEDLAPDLVLIFGGKILKGAWLTVPRLGALNMHYGFLPFYRSSASTQFAIYHDRFDRIGVSIHYIDAGVDTGPVVWRGQVKVDRPASLKEVTSRVYALGIPKLVASGTKSLKANAKLPAETLEAENSYFPNRANTPLISWVAQWRLNELGRPWPAMQIRLESHFATPKRAESGDAFPPAVYAFLYHSIYGKNGNEWENLYRKGAVSAENFAAHMSFLASEMIPLPLSEVSTVLNGGPVKKPYFVVTFDDAYSNIAVNAVPVVEKFGIRPTVFVNSAFMKGSAYYRPLLKLLAERGYAPSVANSLKRSLPEISWSEDPDTFFNQTKDHYFPRIIQETVENIFRDEIGDPSSFNIHLDAAGMRGLHLRGWEVGNHSMCHETLSALSQEEIDHTLSENVRALNEENIPCINWVSYPNGLARHVSGGVKSWMDRNPDQHGIFAGGGVNFLPSRTEWLRMGAGDFGADALRQHILDNVLATKQTLLQ